MDGQDTQDQVQSFANSYPVHPVYRCKSTSEFVWRRLFTARLTWGVLGLDSTFEGRTVGMIRVGVVGSTGLVGESLIRVILGHPQAEVAVLTSAHASGRRADVKLPALRAEIDLVLVEPRPENLVGAVDVAFLATKGPESMQMAPALLEAGVKVVDIGGEFRLKTAADYKEWYGNEHTCPDLLAEAAYGLPELFAEEIATARLVANPGCYPTGAILAVAPLLGGALIEAGGLIFDAYSGVSGAGRTYSSGARNLYQDCNENLRAYAVGKHKHTPEIERAVEHLCAQQHCVTFVPHLAPLDRGILTTAFCRPVGSSSTEELLEAAREFYADAPFVRVIDDPGDVSVYNVRGSNYCDWSVKAVDRSGCVVVVTAIDNTVKGAAGQAAENMNLMFGLARTTGLTGRSL
jgi:N-acetyl-gamma-glutamyl-phosphate reductase